MKLRRRGGMIIGVTDEEWLLSVVRRLSGIAGVWPLWDPRGVMPRLKRRTLPYPEPLRQGLTRTCLWEGRFAMENARHGRALEDVTYALGCCFRAVACLCQVLFAVNRTYLNEKGAVLGTQRLPFAPSDFSARVTCSLRAAGTGDTASVVEELNALVAETEALAASQP